MANPNSGKIIPQSYSQYPASISFPAGENPFVFGNDRNQKTFVPRHSFYPGDNPDAPLGANLYDASKGSLSTTTSEALLNLGLVYLNNGIGSIGCVNQLDAIFQSTLDGLPVTNYASHDPEGIKFDAYFAGKDAPIGMTYKNVLNFVDKFGSEVNYSLNTIHALTHDPLNFEEEQPVYYTTQNSYISDLFYKVNRYFHTQKQLPNSWTSFLSTSFIIGSDNSGATQILRFVINQTNVNTNEIKVFIDNYQGTSYSFTTEVSAINTSFIQAGSYASTASRTVTSNPNKTVSHIIYSAGMPFAIGKVDVDRHNHHYKTLALNTSATEVYFLDNTHVFHRIFELSSGRILSFAYNIATNSVTVWTDTNYIAFDLQFTMALPLRAFTNGNAAIQPDYVANGLANEDGASLVALYLWNRDQNARYGFMFEPYTTLNTNHRTEVAVAMVDDLAGRHVMYALTNTTDGAAKVRVTRLDPTTTIALYTETDVFTATASNITIQTTDGFDLGWLFGTRPGSEYILWSDGYQVYNTPGELLIDFPFTIYDGSVTIGDKYFLRVNTTTNNAVVSRITYPSATVLSQNYVNTWSNLPNVQINDTEVNSMDFGGSTTNIGTTVVNYLDGFKDSTTTFNHQTTGSFMHPTGKFVIQDFEYTNQSAMIATRADGKTWE